MHLRFRRIKNSSAVSEVVGAVLILLITISMFSVVVIWVVSYPLPTAKYHADFKVTLEDNYVNITHLSGETLTGVPESYISVTVNGTSQTYTFSEGGVGTDFSVGETWSKSIESITSSSSVSVLVIAARNSIYQETFCGAYGTNSPIIAFAIAKPSTVPADSATPFQIYAYIIDPDNDITDVYANLSGVGRGLCPMTGSNGIYESSSLTIPTSTSLGMYLFKINATDTSDNTAVGYVSLKVISSSVLEGGGFWPSSSGDGDQGFMIANALDSTEDIRIFNQTDTIWVKVGSSALRNLRVSNLFLLKDSNGTTLTPPTSTSAFTYYSYEGGFYFYAYSFSVQNISGLTENGGVYYAYIELKDYAGHIFVTDATIIIKDIYGNIPSYGIIKTYSDSACTVECRTFNSSIDFIYVKIFTKTTGLASSATVGDVKIRDFVGGTQVKKTPGNAPVSDITTFTDGNYSLSINLSTANQDPWLYPGLNAYTLSISTFLDIDEYYESIAEQIIVIAPRTVLDIIAGIAELTNQAWGTKDYSYFYSNDNLWSETVIDNIGVSPTKYTYKAALGDIDSDTDLDIVASVAAGSPLEYYLYLYRNLGNDWAGDTVNYRTTIDDTETGSLGGRVNSIGLGDVDKDSDLDIVVGTGADEVVYYRNDGNWTRSTVSGGASVYSIALGDLNGDGSLDIAVGRDSGKITIFLNEGNGTFEGEPSTSTDVDATTEWTFEGTRIGSLSNTTSSNDDYENLTEEQGGTLGGATNNTTASDYNTIYGTIPSGTHTDTHTSDDVYEVIKEEAGSDFPVIHKALGEVDADKETKTNDYTWTMSSDDICESLREGKSGNQYYLGVSPYHYWNFGVLSGGVWAEVVDLCIESEIVEGTEWFEIGYSTDASTITWIGNVSRTSEGWDNFTLPISLRNQQVYIHIRDDTNDVGDNDPGTTGDAGYTNISIDYMYMQLGCTSKLEHNWTVLVSGGDDVTVYVEANRSANEDVAYTGGDTDANLAGWFPGWDGDPAQSFTTVDAISVSSVELYLKRETADPSDVYLEIRSDSTVGSVLGTSNTIDSAALSTSYGWTEFIFPGQVDLSSSTKYYLRLCSDPPSTDPFNPAETLIYWGFKQADPSPYAGGEAWRYVGRNNDPGYQGEELTQYDFSFKVWINNDGDDFVFEYSTDGSAFTEMFTVRKVTDNDTYQSYSDAVLDAFSGTLYIRVKDTNRSLSHTNLDSIYVDRISVCSTSACTANSSLEHYWTFSVTEGADVVVWIEAWHTASEDGDNFTFYYSTDNNTYIPMFNVTSTTDSDSYQSYSDATLDAHSGALWIKVMDTDDVTGNYTLDSLYVDHMFVRSTSPGTGWIDITAGSNNTLSLAIADIDGDDDNDIISGDSSGKVYQCLNSGTGISWTVSTVGNAGSAVNGLGIGKLVGDSKLDIAVGTADGIVYMFGNDGSWTRTAIDSSVGSQVNGLAVGDIDGDGDSDVVVGCNGGYVYYYENISPSSGLWDKIVVDYIAVVVYAVDVGNVKG